MMPISTDEKRLPFAAALAGDRTDLGHIVIVDRPAERIRQELPGGGCHERVRPAEQRLAQVGRTAQRRAISELARGIDRRRTVLIAPGADEIEVLQRKAKRDP